MISSSLPAAANSKTHIFPFTEHSEGVDVEELNEKFLESSEEFWASMEDTRWVGQIDVS